MEPITTIADWIRLQRKMLRLTQAMLAARVGCAVITIKKIEQDMRLPSLEMAELLADQLAIPASQREIFLQLARGERVESLPSPLDFFPNPLPNRQGVQPAEAADRATVFVARDPELEQLEAHFTATLNGSGRTVFITGEAGRGKTSLMAEFARRVVQRHSDSVVVHGACDAYAGVGDPYLPFRDIVLLLSGDVESKWEAGILTVELAQRLWALLPHFVSTLVERAPNLVDVLVSGASLVQRARKHGRSNANDAARLQSLVERRDSALSSVMQRQIFEEATQLLRALASYQPLLLLLDDLQWIDNASAGLLFHLGRRLAGSRILILGAYRPSEVPFALSHGEQEAEHPLAPIVHEFRRRYGDVEINLGELSAERGRAFVASLLDQEPNRLGYAFRESLFQRTQGDPLFTVELLREMRARGSLIQNERGEWQEGLSTHEELLPTRVEAVITLRIGRLPARLHEMLKVASVEGETFTAEVVARVLELGERQVVGQLSAIADRQHRFVRLEGSERLNMQLLSHYRFGHILFQKYIYESLDNAERVYLHEAVARTLTTLHASDLDTVSGQIAGHFEHAALFEQAIFWFERAGEKAQRIHAHLEATEHFYKALALLHTLAPSPQRAQQELALQIALGAALVALQGYGTAKVKLAYARVQQLCQQLNQPLTPPVLRALALLALSAPDVAQAALWAEQLLRIAQAEGNPFLLAEGHYMVGVVPFWRGDLIQARSHLELALASYDPNNSSLHIRLYGQDLQVVCLARLALVLWYLGYPAQALQMMEEALVRAHEIAHPVTLAYALCFASWLYNDCRQRQAGEKTAKRLLALGYELGLEWWQAAGDIFYGWIDVQRDEPQRGLALILEGIDGYHMTGQDIYRPYMLSLLAQSYQHMGNMAQALSTVESALEFAADTGQCFWDAELYRLRGELLWMLGKEESLVEANYCQALELARQQQAKALELRAAISLSRLWHKQGQSEKARRLLANSYNCFTEGFDLPDLLDASALLDSLAV